MLNFRKLKQDFPSSVVKEGRELYDKKKVISAKILHLDSRILKIGGRVQGQYDNHYESQIEINRNECEAIDSNCDCPHNFDCAHLTALIFHLEERFDEIMVAYSKENNLEELAGKGGLDEEEKSTLIEQFKKAKTKQSQKQEELYQKQVLQEYVASSEILSISPFFRPEEKYDIDRAEAAIIFHLPPHLHPRGMVDVQLALRLPFRSKPLHISYIRTFLEALRYGEAIFIGSKKYYFSLMSFEPQQREVMKIIIEQSRFTEQASAEKVHRVAQLDYEIFGAILAQVFHSVSLKGEGFSRQEEDFAPLPHLYSGNLETPFRYSLQPARLKFVIEYMQPPLSKILLRPTLMIGEQQIQVEEAKLLECVTPALLFQNVYYRFSEQITRVHLRSLVPIRDMTIPEPLFGTFLENALPELPRFSEIENQEIIQRCLTLPFVGTLKGKCELVYLDGELEASLDFYYDEHKIPTSVSQLNFGHLSSFVTENGVLARNLVEERKIVEELFQDFLCDPEQGVFITKSEKKIVEFMTDIIPRYQGKISFNCPQNLLDQFIYDNSHFTLQLSHTQRIDLYEISVKVEGALKGVRLDLLWECCALRRSFIEIETSRGKKKGEGGKIPKILVLDLEKMSAIVQLFDELGIAILDNHKIDRPLWSLANIGIAQFKGLPVEFKITDKLVDIRKQMLGEKQLTFTPVPAKIQATLRGYQKEGVQWLERLRLMHLNGILADDMGLGKTLQAIVAIAQLREKSPLSTLIVCPTSLLYNWKEEFAKFDPQLKVVVVDGIPALRKKVLETLSKYDVIITSYTLLQKDIDIYKAILFGYVVLDEAQHIKNRGTRNAKSVKVVRAEHRLILSGTPIENALDELWSLFDFLMPGFLGSYERFLEKYIRVSGQEQTKNLEYLRKKVAPFILRRMKSDVLKDLPPVSEITYHCQLTEVQQTLYRSYAASARDELVKLVEREGFDRVQIHILATLTRLKQICCHPAIFAKEKAEPGDSAKYEMLLDLLQTLIEGKHRTVIFSQYTKMLQIMREDLERRNIRLVYLDGGSKNRLELVKQFNEDESFPVFLVSLRAGGTGLNLVGADTVIHYDMWWNPAVENQATDRVHRIGQQKNVSAYKLITLDTIEEKIVELQKRKKGLVKKVISCDDEAIAKLTWEEILELLQV